MGGCIGGFYVFFWKLTGSRTMTSELLPHIYECLAALCMYIFLISNRLNVIGKLIQFSQLTLTYCCFISVLTHQSHFEDAKWSQTWSNKFISQGHNNSGPRLVSSHSFPCCNRSVTLHLCWAGGFNKTAVYEALGIRTGSNYVDYWIIIYLLTQIWGTI